MSDRLRQIVSALLETGTDEPIMDWDSNRTRLVFWFCGGAPRKGHAPDCPWEALIAEVAPAPERAKADDGREGQE